MTRSILRNTRLSLCFLIFLTVISGSQNNAGSTLILNARVADGTGRPLRKASVRITADHITEVGDLKPKSNEQVIDAKNLVLAPGLTEIQPHAPDGLSTAPHAASQISQRITSLVLGAD